MQLIPPTEAFPYPTIGADLAKLLTFERNCENRNFHYGFGSKIALGVDPLTMPAGTLVDCSGFVRAAVHWATGGTFDLPDGSWVEHNAAIADHFKHSDQPAGLQHDNCLRIGFLSPQDGGGVGHVVLILNGETIESCGSRGPCRREWGAFHWMSLMDVFCLTAPA